MQAHPSLFSLIMKFLFVSASICLRLSSDSTSRWTPLSLANSSYCQVCSGLSPPSYHPYRAHIKKGTLNDQCSLSYTGGRARTDTSQRTRDFESRASANSATPAKLYELASLPCSLKRANSNLSLILNWATRIRT